MRRPKGVHAVRKKLANGRSRFHFYAWRGGPSFWVDDLAYPVDPDFWRAHAEAVARPKPKDPREILTPAVVDEFLSSAHVPKGARSRADQRKWLLRFADHFKDAPICIFEDRGSRREVNLWRETWLQSPKQHDDAGVHVTRFLNWAAAETTYLTEHHCHKLKKIYEADRSEIVWTPEHRRTFDNPNSGSIDGSEKKKPPEWVRRILGTACETGLRPGDLVKLTRGQIEDTPKGRRLRVRTAKRKQVAYIPVTPELARIIDTTPPGQFLILTSATGKPLTTHRASEGVKDWRNKAGLTPEALGFNLTLADTRGTAATRLLLAGLSLNDIATFMGWSLRYASQVIENYALAAPDETDRVLTQLALARGGAA